MTGDAPAADSPRASSTKHKSASSRIDSFGLRRLFSSQELRRRNACYLFEEACKVVGELESQQECGLADVVAIHQETFALFDYEGMDVADGRSAGGFVDYIAKIPG